MADLRVFLSSIYAFLAKKRNRHRRRRLSWKSTMQMRYKRSKAYIWSVPLVFVYGLLNERTVWSWFKANRPFWDISYPRWTDRMWVEHLRMKRQTFLYICNELAAQLRKKCTRFREAIPVTKRVAIALWRLATGHDYRSIGQLFGVGRSTCCKITHDVCEAILDVLLPEFIKFPCNARLQEIKDGFKIMSGLRQCVGAIDGTHIPIIAPKEHHSDYLNRKQFHSIVLQAVVDHNSRYVRFFNSSLVASCFASNLTVKKY